MTNIKKNKQGFRKDVELPYEKCLLRGETALSDQELLSILIQTGTKENSVFDISNIVLQKLQKYGSGLTGLTNISLDELKEIEGIGDIKAIKLKIAAEIAKRIWNTQHHKNLSFQTPVSIADYYMESLRHERIEKVILILLDNRMKYLGEQIISLGTVNASLISPREVFICALQMHAVHMILLHNHPSGDPEPSIKDQEITDRIAKLGNMMCIELMDHIIIGDQCYYSFKEQQLL